MPEPRTAEVRASGRRAESGRRTEGRSAGRRLDQPREPGLHLPRFDTEAFGRFAETFARFMGTARFIVYMTVFVVLWISLNLIGIYGLRWDPFPFILLNVFFSAQASYAAPLILLAQNRQADRDRVQTDEDRRRAAAQKADTEYLAREIAALRIAVGEVATRDYLRSELTRLVEEIEEAGQRQKRERRPRRKDDDQLGEPVDPPMPDELHSVADDGQLLTELDHTDGRERRSPDRSRTTRDTPPDRARR